ncbi:MAG: N-acyl homoserine lactonase family protein [Peptococcaceae bacterium]|nr:N-acyl homoserine lactonase family protein [Peptococcaceae bacterium]
MSLYKITPLHLGDITRPKSNMIYGYQGTEVQDFPLIAYYLEGEHKILVDTGGSHPESAQGKKAAPYKRSPEQELDAALLSIGVKPEDIEYVIFTHLHWDHAANNHFFPKAKLLCQRKEWESLHDPKYSSKGYELDNVLQYKYELLDGDQEVVKGVSVILTPGHTLGMQSVVVDTEIGKVICTGDLVTLRQSLTYDPPRFNALLYDDSAREEMQQSLNKVLAISRYILPGHDPEVFTPGMGLKG